ncbi:MAG: hypothetical protein RR865_11575 [Clostridia bacterium]
MKKSFCLFLSVMLLILAASSAFAASTTYYKNLSGGINGKQNTAKVQKGAVGSAENKVTVLSRGLGSSDPIIAKVRYGANGNPVTDASNITAEKTYYMSYKYNEKGKVKKTYYMKMQNTTGTDDVSITGTFKP